MMSNMENNKDLLSVLWGGADILRSKMDANEYKNYLLGMVFYKYLSDTFLVRAYDLINDCKPNTMEQAQESQFKPCSLLAFYFSCHSQFQLTTAYRQKVWSNFIS